MTIDAFAIATPTLAPHTVSACAYWTYQVHTAFDLLARCKHVWVGIRMMRHAVVSRRPTTMPPKKRPFIREESALEALMVVLEEEVGDKLHAVDANSSWWEAPPPFDDIDAVEQAVRASENVYLYLVVQAFSGHFPAMLALMHQVDRSSTKLPNHALRIISGIGALRHFPSVEQLDALEPGDAIIAYNPDRPHVAYPSVCLPASVATPNLLEPRTHSDIRVTCPFCWTQYRQVKYELTGEPTISARHFEHGVYMFAHVPGHSQCRTPDCHRLNTKSGGLRRRPRLWDIDGMHITITPHTKIM